MDSAKAVLDGARASVGEFEEGASGSSYKGQGGPQGFS